MTRSELEPTVNHDAADRDLHVELRDGVTILRLDRAPANALDIDYTQQLEAELQRIEENERGPLVITGTGPTFCAGLDLKALPTYTREQQNRFLELINRLCLRIYAFPRPVVAAVNGHAIAGGLVIVLAADYRIGVEGSSKLGLAEVKVGVPYPTGAMVIVKKELGPAFRRLSVLTGRTVGPKWALRVGLLDEVVVQKHLMERAHLVALEMGQLPTPGYGRIKRQLRSIPLERVRAAVEEGAEPLIDTWIPAAG